MSEFSESCHFHHPTILDDNALLAALHASGLAGVLLPPSGGWQTFVPFDGVPSADDAGNSIGARLAIALGVHVLEYHFAEDYSWMALVWEGADLMTVYTCEFRRKKPKVEGEIGLELLESLSRVGTPAAVIQQLLMTEPPTNEAGRRQGKQFAELMGLQNFELLGPYNILDVLDEMREHGECLLIGTPPVLPKAIALPTLTTRKLPFASETVAWSAREALEDFAPHAEAWSEDAVLLSVSSSRPIERRTESSSYVVRIDADGRTTARGGWSATFYSASKEQFFRASHDIAKRKMTLVADCYRSRIISPLPHSWIDSTAALARVTVLHEGMITEDTPPLHDRYMDLETTEQGVYWKVIFVHGIGRIDCSFEFAVDAESGEVLSQKAHAIVP